MQDSNLVIWHGFLDFPSAHSPPRLHIKGHAAVNDFSTFLLVHFPSLPTPPSLLPLPTPPLLTLTPQFLSVIRRDTIGNKQLTEREALRYTNDECNKALESLVFKCRREQPCHVTSVTMDISYPNDDEVQLLLSAMATKMAPSNESPLEQFEVPFEKQQVST